MFAYSPLAQGLLTGKILPGHRFGKGDMRRKMKSFSDENLGKAKNMNQQLQAIADEYHASVGQLAISWTISQPGITHALCGARNLQQLKENAKAGELTLSEADCKKMLQITDSSETSFGLFE